MAAPRAKTAQQEYNENTAIAEAVGSLEGSGDIKFADTTPNIHIAIARVAADIGAIAKNNQVSAGPAKFNFRGIDDVLDTIHSPLCTHGVSIVPTGFDVLDQSERVTKSGGTQVHLMGLVRYRITGPAGDYVDSAVVAEALDTSDKAASKMMSMAYKYLAFQTFSIPVRGALEESDREQLERGRPDTAPQVSMEDIKGRIEKASADLGIPVEEATGKFRESKGNITVDQMWALNVNDVYGFARQLVTYAAKQAAQSESREEAPK